MPIAAKASNVGTKRLGSPRLDENGRRRSEGSKRRIISISTSLTLAERSRSECIAAVSSDPSYRTPAETQHRHCERVFLYLPRGCLATFLKRSCPRSTVILLAPEGGITLIWLIAALLLLGATALIRSRATRSALRALHRSHSRVDRFKLTKKALIKETLLADETIAAAVKEHSAECSVDEAAAWRRVEEYIDEIVPFFNILTYYKVGLAVSKALLGFFYKISAEYAGRESSETLPRDAIVIYLMNHRSNADYVLVGYVLSGRVAISYAVGEWARTFPLEYIFKSFGAYFIRRKYRERLYQAVLERYVQLITRNGVTQGIFLEGGLSRDGKLGKAKIGLLDYVLGVAREPSMRQRLHVVPVAINYDRVLEDRSLLRELDAREGRRRPTRSAQFGEVLRYVWWNMARLVAR